MVKYLRNLFKSLVIRFKLTYYTFMDRFDNDVIVDLSNTSAIHRQQENSKLARGVRKLVRRLRGMKPEDRTKPENLLGVEPYKKSLREKMDELKVQERVLNNPILKTEDDLVRRVVKRAPLYEMEEEVKTLRKAITAALRQATKHPKDKSIQSEITALRGELKTLKATIARMKHD